MWILIIRPDHWYIDFSLSRPTAGKKATLECRRAQKRWIFFSVFVKNITEGLKFNMKSIGKVKTLSQCFPHISWLLSQKLILLDDIIFLVC